jgi:hypothetical protein
MKADSKFALRVADVGVDGATLLALHGVEAFRGGRADALIRCPFHDDDRPSFSVHLPTGRGHCFSCNARVGDVVALHKALGSFASMGDALRDLEGRRGTAPPPLVLRATPPGAGRTGNRPAGELVEVRRWTYRRADGSPAFDAVRLQFRLDDGSWYVDSIKNKLHKEYRPAAPGSSHWGLPAGFEAPRSRPLFGLPELIEADVNADVFVVEGEPSVDALRSIGSVATTSSGGAAAPEKTDWAPLAGRRVVIWPDNDEAGRM